MEIKGLLSIKTIYYFARLIRVSSNIMYRRRVSIIAYTQSSYPLKIKEETKLKTTLAIFRNWLSYLRAITLTSISILI